uniref:Uncharacterized protein n=1 Tax=Acrobeloides nanus TaxID=290746 RepID=A0A914CE56_9BILA
MQFDKFQLREGFPKKTPIDMDMSGAIMINDKAHVFGIFEVSKKLNNEGEKFLKTSRGILKVQFGEMLKKIREQTEQS